MTYELAMAFTVGSFKELFCRVTVAQRVACGYRQGYRTDESKSTDDVFMYFQQAIRADVLQFSRRSR